jgi:glycogen debranching enzyme
MKSLVNVACLCGIVAISAMAQTSEQFDQGNPDNSRVRDVPVFAEMKQTLPTIVFDGRPDFVYLHTIAWQTALKHVEQPAVDEHGARVLARTYVDAAFSDNIFQWDTCFIMGFAKYGHGAFAFIESLDNFYALQRADGFICREFRKRDAQPVMYPTERDSVNPPLFAWAEVEYARLSGDTARLARVLPVLEKYAAWLESNRSVIVERDGVKQTLYWNTPFGSGMDNTPETGDAWVSMTAQMAEMYESLAIMAKHAGEVAKEREYMSRRERIAAAMNAVMWDDERGVYTNAMADGTRVRVDTIGAFWPLWAGVVPQERVGRVAKALLDPTTFNSEVPFATLSQQHEQFDEWGGYWRGSSWAPTTRMALSGLRRAGRGVDAHNAAFRYIDAMSTVYSSTGTIWENYAPRFLSFAGHASAPQPGQPSKREFVGWSGLGPISILIEDVIGIEADALEQRVVWNLHRTDRVGVQGLQMAGTRLSLVAQARETLGDEAVIDVESDGAFTLVLRVEGRSVTQRIEAGRTVVRVPGEE